jgi:hypothetical protein
MILSRVTILEHTIKDEKGDLFADSHRILVRWRKNFYILFKVHEFNYVKADRHTHNRTTSA